LAENRQSKAKLELVSHQLGPKRRTASDFDLYDFEWVWPTRPENAVIPNSNGRGMGTLAVWVNTAFDRPLRTGLRLNWIPAARRNFVQEGRDLLDDEAGIAVMAHMADLQKCFSSQS